VTPGVPRKKDKERKAHRAPKIRENVHRGKLLAWGREKGPYLRKKLAPIREEKGICEKTETSPASRISNHEKKRTAFRPLEKRMLHDFLERRMLVPKKKREKSKRAVEAQQ